MIPMIEPPQNMQQWWQKFVSLPTYYHLLSAELELRGADIRTLSPALRQARQRNLDRLRDYRVRRGFPQNMHTQRQYIPCFMDHAGRLCAVAYLMHASGETAAVREIAHTANNARLAQIQHDGLDDWAATSGLTMAELARIQPAYAPTIEMLRAHYASLTTTISLIAALGVLSVLTNTVNLTWTYFQRFTVLAGLLLGITLLYLSRAATHVGRGFAGYSRSTAGPEVYEYVRTMQNYGRVALLVGIVALVVAVLRYWLTRRADV